MKVSSILLLLLSLAGCAAPWNTRFPEVHSGLTRAQVDGMLGKPRSAEGREGVEILYYRLASSPLDSDGSDTREYYVTFRDGRVASYGERTDEATMMRAIQQQNAAIAVAASLTSAGEQMAASIRASTPVVVPLVVQPIANPWPMINDDRPIAPAFDHRRFTPPSAYDLQGAMRTGVIEYASDGKMWRQYRSPRGNVFWSTD